jgi:iron(III) transport system substrate-binding protein
MRVKKRIPAKSIVGLAIASIIAFSACSGGGASPSAAPASAPPAASSPASAAPSAAPSVSEIDALYEAAKGEGALVFYSSFEIDQIENLIKGFNAKYPEIKVEYLRGDSLEEQIASEVAAGTPSADTVSSTARRTYAGLKDGWIESYVPPESLTLPEEFQLPSGEAVNIGQNITTFAWNTECVKPGEEPKDWEDLVDPKWAGKVAIQDPLQGGGVTSWLRTLYYEWGEAKWADYMAKLIAQKPIYGNYTATQETLASGEACIMPAAYPTFIEPLKKDGAPLEWGVPASWGITTTNTMPLVKNARHPNAAKLWLNWIASEDGQKTFAAGGGYPIRPGTATADYDRLNGIKLVQSPFLKFEEDADFWTAKIKELFGGSR